MNSVSSNLILLVQSYFEISKIQTINLKKYRDSKIGVCGKDSISFYISTYFVKYFCPKYNEEKVIDPWKQN